jgi:serine protease Do
VLTAGHVSGTPGRDCTLTFHDGKTVKAKTLGCNPRRDSGLIKISEEGKWAFVEMGKSADLKVGQWCITTGHPGGYKKGRTPPVRLGRVLEVETRGQFVRTDCTLVGGDSGGPLFSMDAKVIGIHSQIGDKITTNLHVPVDIFRENWDLLVKGEVVGRPSGGGAYLGVQLDSESDGCKIANVVSGGPADKAGLKTNDNVRKFDGQKIASADDLVTLVGKKKPGDEVTIELVRGEETITLKLKLGKRES